VSPAVRVRFAPSPTGRLHIGGARTALFNWAYARGRQGRFVLRIEDTDASRSTAEYERAILDGLAWLGLDWDEGPDVGGEYGPYRQSERIGRHRARADELLASGAAYPCFCGHERLEELRTAQTAAKARVAYDRRCAAIPAEAARARQAAGEPAVVRFRVPPGQTSFVDHIRGAVTFENDEVEDWVMLRSDGAPTYNFVVVCDDVDMQITHVLRGEEHLVNTPKQVLLYGAFGQGPPEFGHLPLMLGTDGKKLSKRTGDTALLDYRDQGYPRDALVNFLALQGWALDGTTEVFSRDDLVRRFEMKAVTKSGAIFDLDKLRWLSGEYIRAESIEHLAEHCAPFVAQAGLATAAELEQRRAWFLDVLRSERERITTYADLPARIAYLFQREADLAWDPATEARVKKSGDAAQLLGAFGAWLAERFAAGARPLDLREAGTAWVRERGLKLGALFQPLRLALTGLAGGPDLFEVMGLLGPEESLRRIERAQARLA
jgi:glutamyl-tRNA synthetase